MKNYVAMLLLLATTEAFAAQVPDWTSPQQLDHPRIGQVLDTKTGGWLEPGELITRLKDDPYVVVGEKHDNVDHHNLQRWLLEQLHAERPQGSLLLEMLVPAQQAKVDSLRGETTGMSDETLQARLDWQPGWPWLLYGDLIRWGLEHPQRLLSANLDRTEIQQLYRSVPPLMPEYDSHARKVLKQTILDAHCGKLPAAQAPAMLAIQYERDRRMAEQLAAAPVPALLIAGSFHARGDLGVPLHSPPEHKPTVLMLVEAGTELPGPQQADYVWVTPALAATDYCEGW